MVLGMVHDNYCLGNCERIIMIVYRKGFPIEFMCAHVSAWWLFKRYTIASRGRHLVNRSSQDRVSRNLWPAQGVIALLQPDTRLARVTRIQSIAGRLAALLRCVEINHADTLHRHA